MARIILTLSFCLSLLIIATPAYAYLDPGTGSVLLQGILAGIASTLAILKIYWQRLKKYFSLGLTKIKNCLVNPKKNSHVKNEQNDKSISS